MRKKLLFTKVSSCALLPKFFLTIFTFCLFVFSSAQNVGDFKSVKNGNWNSSSTWQVCTSIAPLTWTALTSGYPGAGSVPAGSSISKVTITHEVTIPATMGSAVNLSFGDLIINGGKLNISPANKTTVNFVSTQNVNIMNGTLNMNANQLAVKFPAGTQISINVGNGTCSNSNGINGMGIIGGTCNNNVQLYIGAVLYSTCTGNGGQPFGGNFCDVNNSGGTMQATATPSSLCTGGNVSLSTQSTTGTYLWSLDSGPAGYSIPSGTNVTARTLYLTLTTAGTYVFKLAVTRNGATVYDVVTVVVKPNSTATLSSAVGTNSQIICAGTAIADITYATTGASGATFSGLPAGVSGTWTSKGVTISGKPTVTGTFNYTVTLAGGCGTASATGTITVAAPSSAGLPTASPKVCANTPMPAVSIATTGATGIGTATGLPAGVSASWSGNKITLSGTPTESGTFNYSIPLTGGCGNVSAKGTIYVNLASVFDGVNWSNGVPNDNGLAAEIAADYHTSSGSFNACSCTVNAGKTLTISPNTFVKIENGIVNNGTIIVENDGNLIQVNDNAVNQGNVVVKRAFTFSPERKQYNYVSSPVAGGNLRDIYPGSPAAVYHSESTNLFYTSSGANIQGRALAIKEPAIADVSATTVTASFVGVPFNGILKYPLSYTTANPAVSHGYNLVGNPYPSDLDIDALFDDNNAKIDPTFSFWDNRGNTVYVQQGSAYSGANYTKYNAINGTGVPAGVPASSSGPRIPNRFVKVGSGFMVRARSTANGATLDFKNAYRSNNNTGPGFFGRSSTKDRYWLKLNTPSGIELMTAVVYFPNGNNDFSLDDSATSNSSDDIYTFAAQTAVAINGRAPFSQSDRVMVGVNSFTSGNYTISLGDKEGVFANSQNIYLKDHLTGIVTNLSEGSYTFAISAGQSTGRFELIYEPGSVLATDAAAKDELMVYKDGQDFVVAAKAKKITGLEVYDLLGRMILKAAPNSLKFNVDSSLMPNGVYLLKIDQGGKVTTRKVLK